MLVCLITITALQVMALNETLIIGNHIDQDPANSGFFLRDGSTRIPVGYRVQTLYTSPTISNSPPPTLNFPGSEPTVGDDAAGVYTPNNWREYNYKVAFMGDDSGWLGEVPGYFGAGNIVVYNGDFGNASHGMVRVFSATAVTQAVYYGESDLHTLSSGDNYYDAGQTYNADVINPAYTGMRITLISGIYGGAANGSVITGQVADVSGTGGNNQLDQDVLAIYYRPDSGSGWTEYAPTWTGNGGFSIADPGATATAELMVGVAGGSANLPSSLGPQGAAGVFVVPEPGLAIAGLLFAFFLRKR